MLNQVKQNEFTPKRFLLKFTLFKKKNHAQFFLLIVFLLFISHINLSFAKINPNDKEYSWPQQHTNQLSGQSELLPRIYLSSIQTKNVTVNTQTKPVNKELNQDFEQDVNKYLKQNFERDEIDLLRISRITYTREDYLYEEVGRLMEEAERGIREINGKSEDLRTQKNDLMKQEIDLIIQQIDLIKQRSDLISQQTDLIRKQSDLFKQQTDHSSAKPNLIDQDLFSIAEEIIKIDTEINSISEMIESITVKSNSLKPKIDAIKLEVNAITVKFNQQKKELIKEAEQNLKSYAHSDPATGEKFIRGFYKFRTELYPSEKKRFKVEMESILKQYRNEQKNKKK